MTGNTATSFPKRQISVLLGVLLAHGLFIFLAVTGMFQVSHSIFMKKTSMQLPVPLPMTMVDIIKTPSATGNPTASIAKTYQPIPSTETQSKRNSTSRANPRQLPIQSASKTVKTDNNRQNTKASSMVTDSKNAITDIDHSETSGNGTGTKEGLSAGAGVGDDGGGKSQLGNGSGNGHSSGLGAQSAGSVGSNTLPSFGAAYLNNPAPKYPPMARRMGEQGRVLLRVLVTADGLAKQVNLHSSSGSSALDEAAITAVRKWRFIPAKQDGEAVEAWVQVPIVFKLDS